MDNKRTRKDRNSVDLTQKELAMLRTTSNLTDKEIKLWHAEFLRKYPIGKLDRNTFMETYKELYPQSETLFSCNTLFNVIDTNHDNLIDFNEFLFLAAIGNRTGSLDERLDIIFDLWDVSNDGLLDQNELAHRISAMYDRAGEKNRQGDQDPHKRAKEIIMELDIHGNKKLDKTEFINGCKSDEVIRTLLAPDP
ncbi:unnamed protein product [Rotaria magnacalcarata]|uniref:EF-hand domain-containing protein n=1 Tax=Rotaria magnacalcarata TaxID=392030 RepID=A0A816R260_9BILA|nr:unnamed protein product [Rotaria magnacalcarata]CAF1547939.1 unnamed protein product [Rotaria magnacalcarata]CAF1960460.1 unnamed protein product [Rotaria magnacalcarata]CAF2069193.1 unnamed protein product [Rotaria magnacalcarata]CAF2128508.1 unnamed protein product [Rotaria magnacalcarata]